jgi:hypothetical protein
MKKKSDKKEFDIIIIMFNLTKNMLTWAKWINLK